MSLRTFLHPQARPGREQPTTRYSMPALIRSQQEGPGVSKPDEALNDGPPPRRIPRQWRDGLSGWNGISQFASAQQADGLASVADARTIRNFANLPPPVVPRRQAMGGALAGVSQASSLRIPSVFVPVVNFAQLPELTAPGISNG